MKKQTLLFVTYGGGHVDIVVRLLPHLAGRRDLTVKVLALTTAAQRVAAAGYEYLDCRSFLPNDDYEEAMDLGAELSRPLFDPSVGISWDESCAYLGVSMCDLIADEGRDKAMARYAREGRSAFCPTHFMRQVLIREDVDLVVTTAHVRMERAAILASRELGIATVRIDDLLGYSMLGPYGASVPRKLLPEREWPDHVIVFNGEVKSRITEEGFPAERVHPLGQPVLADWQANFQASSVSSNLVDWRGDDRPIIAYAGTPIAGVFFPQLDTLVGIARRHPEWGICVKLHPSMGLQTVKNHCSDIPDNMRILADEDIMGVVRAADVVVVVNSTVGFLCIFNGVQLIVLDHITAPAENVYVVNGAAVGVGNLDGLESVLAAKLEGGSTQARSVTPKIFENPPNASSRIAQWLHDFISDSNGHRSV